MSRNVLLRISLSMSSLVIAFGALALEPAGGNQDSTKAGGTANSLTVATAGAPGPYVADQAGIALYYLEGETDDSKCTGSCLQSWPPFLAGTGAPTANSGLVAGMIGVIKRSDKSDQVTYNHRPLYHYAGDAGQPGRVNGHRVVDQWGHWYLVSPAGDEVAAKK